MKKVLFAVLVVIMICNLNLYAQEDDSAAAAPDTIAWLDNYNSALNIASTDGRYILIKFYTGW